jgi:adenylate cyclase
MDILSSRVRAVLIVAFSILLIIFIALILTYSKIMTGNLLQVSRRALFSDLVLIGAIFFIFIMIGVFLLIYYKRRIMRPILEIVDVVRDVADGNLSRRVLVGRGNAIGRLGEEINTMIRRLEERLHLPEYVSKTAVEFIKRRRYTSEEGKKQILTVLFSDIRNFTGYLETHNSSEVIKVLKKILEIQALCVEQWQGDIDRFIGDTLLAIFKSEYSAVQCAYHMIQSVTDIDRKLHTGLRVGIGINSGEVLIGNIGNESSNEYAVLGDTINIASKLGKIARPNMILITESVREALGGKVIVKPIPDKTVKGKTSQMKFYIVQSVLDEETSVWLK